MTEDLRSFDSAVSDIQRVNEYARSLERSEVRRCDTNVTQARRNIARRLGVTTVTLDNLRTLRTKIVPNWLMNKVRAELISVLQLELQKLEHELHTHKQVGSPHSDDDLASAQAHLTSVRQILSGQVKT